MNLYISLDRGYGYPLSVEHEYAIENFYRSLDIFREGLSRSTERHICEQQIQIK